LSHNTFGFSDEVTIAMANIVSIFRFIHSFTFHALSTNLSAANIATFGPNIFILFIVSVFRYIHFFRFHALSTNLSAVNIGTFRTKIFIPFITI
jgi:hypothetical protein